MAEPLGGKMIILTEMHSGKRIAIPAHSVISAFEAGAGDCRFAIVNMMHGHPNNQARVHVLETIEEIVAKMSEQLGEIEDI